MPTEELALRFCNTVLDRPKISNATARIGAWLIASACRTGGFPIELSLRQMQYGFIRDGVEVMGTGCRPETLKAAIQWMEDNEVLISTEGSRGTGPHSLRSYTMVVR